MTSVPFLVLRTLGRTPARTALVVLGLSVTGALLLDMTMLAGGLEASLGAVLSRLGFAIRVVPRGTLPFSGSAVVADADRLASEIAAQPGVADAIPVAGGDLYLRAAGRQFPAFALGVRPGSQGVVYRTLEGTDPLASATASGRNGGGEAPGYVPVVVNRNMVRLDGVRLGDRLLASGAPRSSLQTVAAVQACRVVGIADFYFDLPTQRSIAIAAPVLRRLLAWPEGSASLILVRMTDPARATSLARWIQRRDPRVDAFSIEEVLARTGARLTYFNQFSLILGTISVAVSFLLIAAIVTLSLGERLGEIAMLRAVGFTRSRIVTLVAAEGVALATAALPGGLLLGIGIAANLDRILLQAPGVPQDLHFFTLTPAAMVRTVSLLLATGALGALYPAMLTARLPIAETLHREILS
jgi:putative ABC transport system permease protein